MAVFAQEEKTTDKDAKRMDDFQKKIEVKKTLKTPSTSPAEKEHTVLFPDTVSRRIEAKSFPDVSNYYAECYMKVVNQYGFWKGVGPKLSKEDIRHMWRYVKLLRPTGQPDSAPFTHMQVLNSFGYFDNNSYGPILANPFGSDDGISSSWKLKLENICQFEKIFRDGKIVQENMYDEQGKLILQYYPTSVSKNQIVGHYTDAYGTLAKLRDDEDCTYVGITLDDFGYESQIAFMDADGRLKRNGDDAFIQLVTHDAHGNLLKIMSADAVGNPIIDNWGNCGWQYTYDKKGRETTATCINQYGLPQRMEKKKDPSVEDYVRARITYDKWNNVLSRTFYDENWHPDTITGGIHRFAYTKTLNGNTTSMRSEGLDGHVPPMMSTWQQKFDSEGNRIYFVEQNADKHYRSSGTCIEKAHYENDKLMWKEEYSSPNGVDSVLNYRYVRTPTCDSIFYYDEGYINIEHYDDKRRIVSDEYYNLLMIPIKRNNYNYHKITTTYIDRANCSIVEKRYLDENGRPSEIGDEKWRNYNVKIQTHDFVHKTYSNFEYDGMKLVSTYEVDSVKRQSVTTRYENGRIIEKYANDLSEDCSGVVGILFYDSLGYRGRTFKADALYYNAHKYLNIQGKTVAWKGINEFGESSYILNGDWKGATLYCTNVVGDPFYYDENGDTIPRSIKERKAFKENLYKAFCIELISTEAYRLGLRSGDIIVRYGDWHYPLPSSAGRYRELLLCLETVRKATAQKTIVVMRHDGEKRTSSLKEFILPAGTPKDLGFLYHMIYLTNKERKRYEEVIGNNRLSVHLDSVRTDEPENSKISFFTPYKVGNDSDKALFKKGFQENVVVIAWEPHVNGRSYLLPCNSNLMESFWKKERDSVTIHYTVDGKHVLNTVLSSEEVDQGGRYTYIEVGDASDMSILADSLQKVFDERNHVEKIVLKPHAAAEQLLQLPGTEVIENDGDSYRGKGVGKYGNVNAFYGVSVNYDSLSYNEMFMVKNILENIDYSDYCYMSNANDYGYFLETKGRFSECSWTTSNGINFLSDSVDFYNKTLITAEVVDSGFFRQQGLEGKYAVLKCNDWIIGGAASRLFDVIKNGGKRSFVLVKLEDEEGNNTLGRQVKIVAPEEWLGISLGLADVSDETFYKAYQYAKRRKRNARR